MAQKKQIKITVDKPVNTCFVVMPFNPNFQSQYENVIFPAISDLGIECIRGDEIYTKQRIMDDIWNSLRNCRFVLAELTGKNPNVMYEIGLAHALGKPVIILTRDEKDVPFDLKDLRYLFYDINDPFWGENLANGIKAMVSKVLENTDINVYLEGIEVPTISEYKTRKVKKTETKITDPSLLTGTWEGAWHGESPGRIKHNIVLHLFFNGQDLSGTATITFKDPILTIVQQSIIGSVKNESIILKGVSYTFVEKGSSPYYNLDYFELNLVDNRLIGISTDTESSEKADIVLKKTESEVKQSE